MFGFLPYGGAFAERVLVPAAQFSEVPGQVSDEAAAAFVTSFLTADAALCTVGHLQRGETVVVQAAAGGLGGAAVQLCRLYGAGTVIGTAGSAERREYVRSIGADVAVHYSEVEEAVRDVTGGRGADLVLESVGGDAFDQSVACLHQLGRLVTLGASSGQRPSSLRLSVLWSRGISVAGLHLTRWMEDMPELLDPSRSRTLEALARGKITPAVGATFSIKNVADAFQALHGRVVNGKVVVVFDDDPTDPIDPVSQ
jgi:NADPH2:quinone reductase